MAQNKINNVLVVGGSSGIGLAVAKLALSHLPKANVIISSSSKDKLEKAVEEIRQTSSTNPDAIVDFIVGDVSKYDTQFDDVEAILKAATARFGAPIDHIVWTAGAIPSSSGGQEDRRDNDDLLETATTRLFGPLTLTKLAKQYMASDSRRSSITFTSGALLYRPMKGMGRFTGIGGGLESGARGMAVDLAPIRVNSVVLGLFDTPLSRRHTGGNPAVLDAMAQKTLLKSVGAAEEAAEAYLYSMRCAYVTGSRIDAEGGMLLA